MRMTIKLLCIALIFLYCSPMGVAQDINQDQKLARGLLRDDTSTNGEYLGQNEVRTIGKPSAYVIGRHLFMYSSSNLDSEPLLVLGEGEFAEIIDSRDGALLVQHVEGLSNGEVTYSRGWIDERFVIISNQYYVAMHPTPVYIDTATNAKIIRMLDTYESLIVIEERNDFLCVMINGGIGYVEKE